MAPHLPRPLSSSWLTPLKTRDLLVFPRDETPPPAPGSRDLQGSLADFLQVSAPTSPSQLRPLVISPFEVATHLPTQHSLSLFSELFCPQHTSPSKILYVSHMFIVRTDPRWQLCLSVLVTAGSLAKTTVPGTWEELSTFLFNQWTAAAHLCVTCGWGTGSALSSMRSSRVPCSPPLATETTLRPQQIS